MDLQMGFQLVSNLPICPKPHGNHDRTAGDNGDDGDQHYYDYQQNEDDGLNDNDHDLDAYHDEHHQANNLCELGIERDTLLELCKNFEQMPQVKIGISEKNRLETFFVTKVELH